MCDTFATVHASSDRNTTPAAGEEAGGGDSQQAEAGVLGSIVGR